MKNIIVCDKCGAIGHLVHDSTDQRSESVWVNPDKWNSISGIDFCEKCSLLFEQFLGKKPVILNWNV